MSKKALEDARKALAAAKAKRLAAGSQGKTPSVATKSMPEELKKSLRKWGAKSLDDLIHVNTSDKKFAYISAEEKANVKALKEAVDVAVISSQIFQKKVTELKYFEDELQFHLKAFGITTGTDGFEWIPTVVASSYLDEFNLDRKVSGLFMEVKMPSNPYKWPVLTGGAIARKVGLVTALATPQSFKTDKTITFDAVKLTNQYALPEELNEDSAIDQVKVIRQELIEGQEKALEIAILEGDADGTHQHYFTQLPDVAPTTLISAVADSPEQIFDGLRKRLMPNGSVDATGVALNETHMSKARAKMGKFGVDPSQLAWIMGPKVYNQSLQLDDVRTLEQYGAQATVISGELAKYEGSPIVVSEYLREDLAATGYNTQAGPNTFGSAVVVNRKRWFVGTRRPISVLVEKNRTQYDVLDLVSFCRKAFQAVLKSDGSNYASESSGAVIFNIAC